MPLISIVHYLIKAIWHGGKIWKLEAVVLVTLLSLLSIDPKEV